MKQINFYILIAILFPILVWADGMPAYTAQFDEENAKATVDYSGWYIEVTGIGRADADYAGRNNVGGQRTGAFRQARMLAYEKLARVLGQVRVNSETTIYQSRIIDSDLDIQFKQFVQGAQVVDRKDQALSDGSYLCEVTLGILLAGNENSAMGILFDSVKKKDESNPKAHSKPHKASPQVMEKAKEEIEQQQSPSPSTEKPISKPAKPYTGLIIDGRGLGLQPAMNPRILAEDGREIYSIWLKVNRNYAIKMGLVGYGKSVEQAKQDAADRLGENPLIIKAKQVKGTSNTDVVVSDLDAAKILYADQLGDFLPDCRVVFLVGN